MAMALYGSRKLYRNVHDCMAILDHFMDKKYC